jgi:hypothetical protein
MARRFGLLMIASLLLWPAAVLAPLLQPVVVNALLLDTYGQLAFLTATNVLALFFAIAVLRFQNHNHRCAGPLTALAGDGTAPWGWWRISLVTLLGMITPSIVAYGFGTEFELSPNGHASELTLGLVKLLSILAGAAMALLLLAVAGFLKCVLVGSETLSANFFPFEATARIGLIRLSSAAMPIWLGRCLARVAGPDGQFLAYLLLLMAIHRCVLPLLDGDSYSISSAPAAVVLLLWVLGMACAGAARVLDPLRLPVFWVLVLLIIVLSLARGSTRPLRCYPLPPAPEKKLIANNDVSGDTAWEAVRNRMSSLQATGTSQKGRTAVVVTCPGGGIHAAAWAACVLDKLCDEYAEFKDSVCVISGVSGGSVGTLLFVGSRFENELLAQEQTKVTSMNHQQVTNYLRRHSPALELAARSSLEPIAFGLMINDLYGFLPHGTDRGERLEQHIANRLDQGVQGLTLNAWGERSR